MNITLYPHESMGTVKPLHGLCNGPISMGGWTNMSEAYAELHVPFVRLHDTDYPYPQQVDVFQIFRDFDADPTDPANYDFLLTDQFITAIHNVGAQIIYRLGTSIEHMPIRRWVHPPKDNAKFAVVCEHIIRHYNEGWANGFAYGIRHWEIWNEPEDHDGRRPHMWTGTKAQYFALYDVVSKHLKAQFGDRILVGGYASCGFRGLRENPTENERLCLIYFHDFINFIKANGCPLDFFSYHYYGTDPRDIVTHAEYAHKCLAEAGYGDAALILDEWNSSASTKELGWITTMRGARYVLDIMAAGSDSPLAIATYYDGQPHMPWCGLFNRLREKQKPFYAFKMYDRLYRLGERVRVACDGENTVLAATDGGKIGLLIVGGDCVQDITVRGFVGCEGIVQLLDDTRDAQETPLTCTDGVAKVHLPVGAVAYLEV